MTYSNKYPHTSILACSIFLYAAHVHAQVVVSDTLTGASSSYGWQTFGGACLTAGDGSTSTIPACTAKDYLGRTHVGGVNSYLPDPIGQGALRLTNGGTAATSERGAVISTSPFGTNQGVQVTFSTVTYGGNAYKNSKGILSGADGLAFFLIDGDVMNGVAKYGKIKAPTLGAVGGSLGYSCSNGNYPYDGVAGGYLAVAIDEYGNFSNSRDSTADGSGPNPGAIVVRGSGSVTYKSLNAQYPSYYPSYLSSGDQQSSIQSTCQSGTLWDYSDPSNAYDTGIAINDYAILKQADGTSVIKILPTNTTPPQIIYSQESSSSTAKSYRSSATPITYGLSITQDGYLNLSYSYNGGSPTPIIANLSITKTNGTLPPSFLFGFTAGTGGGTNVHEITCFKAAQINVASDSAGANVQQTGRVQTGSQVYLAYYHPTNSWGQLTASNLLTDSNGVVSISSTPNWDANCVLTGCTTGQTIATAQAPTARNIIAWNGATGTGIPFQYTNLSAAQQTAIGGSTDGSKRVSYLRGDRTNEIGAQGQNTGVFRVRTGVLGDIINSSPLWVGPPSVGYPSSGNDLLSGNSIAEFGSYNTFSTTYAARTNVVYVGANDGMLHGFRASGTNDGKELIAYVPDSVITSIHPSNTNLDFSSAQYAHNSYVDATPGTGDLYYKSAWHTWAVGGLGAGGNSTGTVNDSTSTINGVIYALDITDPTKFTEANASTLVKGEWNSSNITCSNDTTCNTKLGSVYGTPLIRYLHDGNWAAIFGNGRNSANGTAGIFIMSVNKSTGAVTFRYLDTGNGSTSAKNSIDYVASADLDGDHVVDYIYAGDSNGNIWRFDLTNSDPTKWAAGTSPLFTTPNGQPISTKISVNSVLQKTGASRLVLNFGTGRQTPQTLTSAAAYASGTQSLYGIWDWNMASWNTKSSVQYVSLAAPQSPTVNDLQVQTMNTYTGGSNGVSGYRIVSQNPVCWKGSTSCTSGSNNKFGWKLDLTGTNEQVIYNPVVAFGGLFVNTTIPAVNQVLSCTSQPASGYTMALSPETGGAPLASFLQTAATNAGITGVTGIISGLGLSGTGSPTVVTSATKRALVQQTVTGQGVAITLDNGSPSKGKRVSWVKLR